MTTRRDVIRAAAAGLCRGAFAATASQAAWPTGEWPRSTPQAQGMDAALLEAGDRFIRGECATRQSFLVVRNGYLVHEAYFAGNHRARLNHVMSISKSFLAALTGIALDQGYLKNLDQKVLDFLPEYSRLPLDERTRDLSIRHLLTMTGGFRWREDGPEVVRWVRSRDWVRFTLERPMVEGPGGNFNYNTGLTHLLSAVLTKATGVSTEEFARRHLFQPLGIRRYRWTRDPKGIYVGGFRMYFTAEDLARFAYLHLRKGNWEKGPLISSAWVEQATTRRVENHTALDLGNYGYLWWIRRVRGYEHYFAAGFGGQHVHIIPALDLAMVTTASDARDTRELHTQAFEVLTRYVVPAVDVARGRGLGAAQGKG